MAEDQDFSFDWEVLEVVNNPDSRGAIVRYTPTDPPDLSVVEKFVPIPWQKVRGVNRSERVENAREIAKRKINAYAPVSDWNAELVLEQEDHSEEISQELESAKPRGKRERRRRDRPA